MRSIATTLGVPAAVVLLLLLPTAAATAPLPLHGVVTSCKSNSICTFSFNTSAGTGWANGTAPTFSFQLPGEAKASYNLSYSTYIESLTGTYTYWTVGSFFGTDVNTGHVVLGATDTNYTITCHGHSGRGGGCTYTYTTDNGTIVVEFTKTWQTTTSISCAKGSSGYACSVAVKNDWNASNIPRGKVNVTDSGYGTLSNHGTCTLSSGKCSFTFHVADDACGYAPIAASYLGTSAFYPSSASTSIYVQKGC